MPNVALLTPPESTTKREKSYSTPPSKFRYSVPPGLATIPEESFPSLKIVRFNGKV